ncbi:NADH-quinone oxidoreductase subunit NuoE [Chloroflexota bacterium]
MESNSEEQLDGILAQYDGERGDLIPILQEAQERFGYLPPEAMSGIAKFLRMPESTVYGVSTFYAQFKFSPIGKRIVKVCRGTACHVKGGERILESVQRELGIQPGQTTDDLEYSLEVVACIGACALAPTMMIDDEVQRKMTTKKVVELFGNKSKAKENAM